MFTVPCLFANADTPEGAEAAIAEMDRHEENYLDDCTLWWKRNLRPQLLAIKDGAPPAPEVVTQVARINGSPLEEGPGEGYRRGTHYTKVHAPSATREHIIASQRYQGSVDKVLGVITKYPIKGNAVLNYEWVHFKRILNNPRNQRHRLLRRLIDDRTFFRKFYIEL